MARRKDHKKPAEPEDDLPPILAPGGRQLHAFREVKESIVVAFVLAFMFRTFVAEAFVIPTGSMSPALQGAHKDVHCDQCGYRFRTTASSENPEDMPQQYRNRPEMAQTVGGMCPMCRRLMPMRPDLDRAMLEAAAVEHPDFQPTYPGDRIVVSKFGFDFQEPERWDVVVFKFPGDGNMNYIKRLTGLPGDELRITQGDLFIKSPGEEEFAISQRPPELVAAMLQPVHDTDYEPSVLQKAGWPLRWAATTPDGWQHEVDSAEQNVVQKFTIDAAKSEDEPAWIRYRHIVPDSDIWQSVLGVGDRELSAAERELLVESARPELISDFNPYNARLQRDAALRDGWQIRSGGSTGYEWVGDLAVECEVEVASDAGEILLDLVEAGYHLQASIAIDTGAVTCRLIDGRTGEPLDWQATGSCSLKGPGDYDLRFANVNDRVLLWVDGEPVELAGADWDPDSLPGGRDGMIPWASENDAEDQGDLSPAGVGARGATIAVNRLQVLRDIYYIAVEHKPDHPLVRGYMIDYPGFSLDFRLRDGARVPRVDSVAELMSQRSAWTRFAARQAVEFQVGKDQFFVMGDNSPESADARVWTAPESVRGRPGGNYVDRRLLIGKALAVFWPHSWGSLPGLEKLPGWPNFRDMRLVR